MTIAIGILAADGIVLAADSEISTNGDVKGIGRKMVAAVQETYGEQAPKSIGIAGAGSLGYFESIRFKVAMVILGAMSKEPFTDSNVENALEDFMTGFHERHVIPYAAFQIRRA
jgi:hypothetical protein